MGVEGDPHICISCMNSVIDYLQRVSKSSRGHAQMSLAFAKFRLIFIIKNSLPVERPQPLLYSENLLEVRRVELPSPVEKGE